MTPIDPTFFARPIAHRGLHGLAPGHPENSLAACLAAVEAGYGIELDVQLSADGEAMVFHDETLDRMTAEQGPLKARTSRELTGIPLSDGAGGTIPRLADVLAAIRGRVSLLIEIKDQSGCLGATDGRLEAAVARDLSGHPWPGAQAVMSFNPESVAAMANQLPNVARGLVTCPFDAAKWPHVGEERRSALSEIRDLERTAAAFISHAAGDLAAPSVGAAREAGRKIACWTIRSPEAEAEALRIADAITFEGYLPT
ncbi:MAG: glycerophosphodiester phosphodiesterase family protein [Pseudomonadota bacterium]